MKLHILGSGSIDSTAMSASYLIDERLLLDVPNGIVKQMKRLAVDIQKIDYIYISHFHADHYFDLPLLLLELALHKARNRPLYLIGQPATEERLHQLFKLAYSDIAEGVIERANIHYITVDPQQPQTALGYSLNFYEMCHDTTLVYGLIVQSAAGRVGFTFDTTYCPAVDLLARQSDLLFADMSSLSTNPFHMGPDSIAAIKKNNEALRLIATHMSDDSRRVLADRIECAADGQIIHVQ